ncbi:Lrp/AsnC family transcriptional regulator [Rhodococcus sp. Eu-32]|uniref:Lrp/AsnC family transcriptional regulator n=1 Tax=Rhodococcus sp. Eu-32 TaxID=1017319 RepID=UPI000DF36777|nr:Lrp/AsnC family transcriptional regulator [Rhodococcus sp. Eu-32]RRQ29101.1 Lrp/AsnC family transcriptional regulator [Rhodococcus sp. Eu-32]
MVADNSDSARSGSPGSNDVRRAPLDAIDHILIDELRRDARMPNNALAAAAGIAPSTALGRVRSLVERGVIRGFHAEIDPDALGQGIQAMISVRLQADARRRISEFGEQIAALPETSNIYFIAGADDFLIHVATVDTVALRHFVVDNLSAHPAVAATETILIFEHIRPRGHRTPVTD